MAGQPNDGNAFGDFKKNVNIAYALCLWHQRAIIPFLRGKFGVEALGFSCLMSFFMMMLWFVCTHDNGFLLYIPCWLLCVGVRRIEATKLNERGVKIHSQYCGVPFDALKFCRSESTAKRWVEPIMVGVFGFLVFKFYQEMGWRETGLPYFLMLGFATLAVVEGVNQEIWKRRAQAVIDAQLEGQQVMNDVRNRFGN